MSSRIDAPAAERDPTANQIPADGHTPQADDSGTASHYVEVWLDGSLAGTYTYRTPDAVSSSPASRDCAMVGHPSPDSVRIHAAPPPAGPSHWQRGTWIVVPWGRQQRIGLICGTTSAQCLAKRVNDVPLDRIRNIDPDQPALALPVMADAWMQLMEFTGRYYHAPAATVALGSVPRPLKTAPKRTDRANPTTRRRSPKAASASPIEQRLLRWRALADDVRARAPIDARATLTSEQRQALERLMGSNDLGPPACTTLLHGATGSGKTEVYLHWFEHLLAEPCAQVMLLVPEIGLTPQLLDRLQRRFPDERIAMLHSAMPDAERASHWVAAATGEARLLLGTRLAVLAAAPHLRGIVVDEEHDTSYRQQEGVRYSARDLAVARGRIGKVPVVLGSATPSLETLRHARAGRYELLRMTERPGGAIHPDVRCVDIGGQRLLHGLGEQAIGAIEATLARRRQALVFLNRRGFAQVLECPSCGWLSRCTQCAAHRVLHHRRHGQRATFQLICHHCGSASAAPRACPQCGDADLQPVGHGTQRLEQALAERFPQAAIGRLDRDVARRRGATEAFLREAHAGRLDILLGTQMLAKGHDFEQLDLVVIVNADAGLFASDFRAPERLFATLLQVIGRAGRHLPKGDDAVGTPTDPPARALTLIQTRHPTHPVFDALARNDFDGFAATMLDEREALGLPPYSHQALFTAQARTEAAAIGFLQGVRRLLVDDRPDGLDAVQVCDPVPMPLAQLRGMWRAQLLLESPSRPELHRLLDARLSQVAELARTVSGALRWHMTIDPAEI